MSLSSKVDLRCLAVPLLFVLFFGMGLALQSEIDSREKARDMKILADFGSQGKIVEVYRVRTGNKNANYEYHTLAIVENEKGDRLTVAVGRKSAVTGDIWTLDRDPHVCFPCQNGHDLVLGELVQKG